MQVPRRRQVHCLGGINIDRKLRPPAGLQMGVSNPVSLSETPGGVARNVAENLAHLGLSVSLQGAVGADARGHEMLAALNAQGVDTRACLRIEGAATGSYTAVLDAAGELAVGLAHMELADRLTPAALQATRSARAAADVLLADLNLPTDSLSALLAEAHPCLVFVAASAPKMARLPQDLSGLHALVLNEEELHACATLAQLHARGCRHVVLTRGAAGVLISDGARTEIMPAPAVTVVDVTGAGDAFAAGLCAGLTRGDTIKEACRPGLARAALTLQSEHSVAP